MKEEAIQSAVELGEKVQNIFVATADAEGLPHVAAAGRISSASVGYVAVSAWFCPGTVMNLQKNSRVALVVWDAAADIGYQILGVVEKVEEEAMMDGYSAEMEESTQPPQVERQLLVHVDKVLHFSHAPHIDVEE